MSLTAALTAAKDEARKINSDPRAARIEGILCTLTALCFDEPHAAIAGLQRIFETANTVTEERIAAIDAIKQPPAETMADTPATVVVG